MNVLYAGINNDIRIAVPGVPNQNVSASISNGSLTNKGNGIWGANPKYGSDAVITVTGKMADGRAQTTSTTFRVRQLPDPTPYLNITNAEGNKTRYKVGTPISKPALITVDALNAAIDDGILDQPFAVVRFDLVKSGRDGFRMTTSSEGAKFTQQQKDVIRDTQRGQILFVSGIVVRGPDGGTRTLNAAMEIRIN
jgi:gliding motility-associated protein GldM